MASQLESTKGSPPCRRRRGHAVAVAAAVAVCVASSASAHPGGRYWSVAEAESAVYRASLQLDGRQVRMGDCSCFGVGRIRLRVQGVLKFQHFRCLIAPQRERRFWIFLHPLPRGWTYEFQSYAE